MPVLAEVGSLYVLPFYQNRGIGRKMVNYACLVAKAGAVLRRPCVRRWLDRLTGTVLVAFGLRLAAERH